MLVTHWVIGLALELGFLLGVEMGLEMAELLGETLERTKLERCLAVALASKPLVLTKEPSLGLRLWVKLLAQLWVERSWGNY